MASTEKARPMGDLPDAFMGLLQAQMKWGQQLYEDVTGSKAPDLARGWNEWQRAMQQPIAAPRSACHVPPPCWMPRKLGDVVSYASGCSTVRVRITISNCDRVARVVKVRTDGVEGMTVTPETVTLNPMRRATVEVSYKVPESVEDGSEQEALVWIEGAHDHVLRWTVMVGRTGMDTIHEIAVDDCPDYRHHWYDHFYCVRPGQAGRGVGNG